MKAHSVLFQRLGAWLNPPHRWPCIEQRLLLPQNSRQTMQKGKMATVCELFTSVTIMLHEEGLRKATAACVSDFIHIFIFSISAQVKHNISCQIDILLPLGRLICCWCLSKISPLDTFPRAVIY